MPDWLRIGARISERPKATIEKLELTFLNALAVRAEGSMAVWLMTFLVAGFALAWAFRGRLK